LNTGQEKNWTPSGPFPKSEAILRAREERWQRRLKLVEEHLSPVATVTLNIPGMEKDRSEYIKVHSALVEAFRSVLDAQRLAVVHQEFRCDLDGPEAYLAVKGAAVRVKQLAIYVEENHPLGRLADIDVLGADKRVIGRRELGEPERRCLICSNQARFCLVQKKHSLEEVLERIQTLIKEFSQISSGKG
jgi:holo-ACP synthase